jgi:ABC-type multidrug transport system ATPase subunit
MIHVENLRKTYGPRLVLDGVSFDVSPGELVLLLGGNGTGKSTLLRCLLGLVSYAGVVRIAGFDPLRQACEARRRVGYMPQSFALHLNLTVADTLWFHSALRGVAPERARALLADVHLADTLNTAVSSLSGGMRQRLQFAISLLDDPPVLLLDEPTASLDDWSRDFLVRRVRELADAGKAVLLSTHARAELAAVADRAIVLEPVAPCVAVDSSPGGRCARALVGVAGGGSTVAAEGGR